MKVLVDTSVWSLALRRRRPNPSVASSLADLVLDARAVMIGPVRQEVLSGVRDELGFQRLLAVIDSIPDQAVEAQDYVTAAKFFNTCRANGIQGSPTDFLICAVAAAHRWPVFTTDQDFAGYAEHLPICLYEPPDTPAEPR